MEKIGLTGTDIINGRSGIITACCVYITGCNQLLISPKSKKGEAVESFWADEQRVIINNKVKRINLKNGAAPGFDKAAPIR